MYLIKYFNKSFYVTIFFISYIEGKKLNLSVKKDEATH